MAFDITKGESLTLFSFREEILSEEDRPIFLGLIWTARLLVTVLFIIFIVLSVRAAEAAPAFAPGQAEELRAGLFFKSGRADAVFEAPTLASDVKIDISGLVARVTVRQRFQNPSNAWLEGVYVFPLPERSAVDELVMTIGERRIIGDIMEREAAKQVYREAAQQGRRASLLSSARPNVFITSVANVGPGETVTVEIGYQDKAAYERGRMNYRFPMVVAPRFTPAPVREVVRAPPLRLTPEPGFREIAQRSATAGREEAAPTLGSDLFGPVRHPDEGPANPVSLRISLDAGRPFAVLESPSHEVEVASESPGRALVTLSEGSVPADRDFLLQWHPEMDREPEPALFAEEVGGSTYLLVNILPPSPDQADVPSRSRQPRDLVLIVDRSGSMHGQAIFQAKQALNLALDSLRPDDRFNIISFASDTESLFRNARPASAANIRGARRHVAAIESGGGTMMRPALHRALDEPARDGALRQVVFLTDGAVSNEHELLLDITGKLGRSRLFTVGLGSAPNGYFMRRAAELGRGSFVTISDLGQVAERMAALFRRLEQPQMTDIEVAWPPVLAESVERHPAVLPDLYADQPIRFTARLEGSLLDSLPGELVVTAQQTGGLWRRVIPLADLHPAKGIAALWARDRFAEIQDQAYRGVDADTIRAQALPLALAHRLVTRYTSLVAVDTEPARPADMALDRTHFARNLPAGMNFEKVFGEPASVMPLRPVPGPLLRDAAFRGQQAIALPQTATPAPLLLLSGAALLVLGLTLLLMSLRMRRLA